MAGVHARASRNEHPREGVRVIRAFLTYLAAHSGGTVPDSHRVPTSNDRSRAYPFESRMLPNVPTRPVLDRCPGVLRPHDAADGLLIRLRQPGGRFSTRTLVDLVDLAAAHGAPFLHLTSRGNLQLRALPSPLPGTFVQAIDTLGLLPDTAHERVRNIVAAPSPLLDELIKELDAAVIADETLTHLPGRFLFALSDDSGRCLDLRYDIAYQAQSSTDGVIISAGRARACPRASAVSALIELAHAFLHHRPHPGVWNVRDLDDSSPYFTHFDSVAPPPVVTQWAGEFEVGVPLGLLDVRQVHAVAAEADDVVVTPSRSLVLRAPRPGWEARLATVGLEATGGRAAELTACIGGPYCRRAISDTVDITRQALTQWPAVAPRTHVVGCPRACGAPTTDHILVVAPRSVDDILTTQDPR